MSEDDDFVPISALQHVIYCDRQAALIHVERVWEDNQLTALGNLVHARTDEGGRDQRRGVRVERSVVVHSNRLKLLGVCDAVEWRNGVRPIETKRGPVVERHADQVQLCAQALCLEEMLEISIPGGVLFYAASHRRVEVPLTASLRSATEAAAWRMREIIDQRLLPRPQFGAKCRMCSLKDLCQPEKLGRSTAHFLERAFRAGS